MNDGPTEWESSETGRRQFVRHQSTGEKPSDPDPYYWVLTHGKKLFDLRCSELQQMWGTPEWPGLYQLWVDYRGKRWVLPQLLKWRRHTLPGWITQEDP